MKRISLLAIVILMIAPCVAKAFFYDSHYSSVRYRTRWSPYAFGLISGDIRYSPYAFSHKHNGLITGDVRYSPYAFSHKHNGLVSDPWYGSTGSIYVPPYRIHRAPVMAVQSIHYSPCALSYKHSDSSNENNDSYEKTLIARRERIKQLRDSRKQINVAKGTDGKEIIYRYLKSRNIDNFETTGLLKINDKTVNVSFLLKDKNIMITYWDLDEVRSLLQQPGYKRNYYEKHEQEWKNLCQKYIQAGGKVYPITSADAKEILAKLTLCPELNDG
jgi:hypothetical protein